MIKPRCNVLIHHPKAERRRQGKFSFIFNYMFLVTNVRRAYPLRKFDIITHNLHV